MKITIDNEEVLSNKDFTINEEMLNTSSVILNNVYPVEWEQDKDYVSRFYYPEDYSKCKIFNEIYHPEEKSTANGTSFTLNNVDLDKQYYIEDLKGQTSQNGTPTPSSPVPVETTTGRQEVVVCEKNLFDKNTTNILNANLSNSKINSSANERVFFMKCKPNTTYTFSISLPNSYKRNTIATTSSYPNFNMTIDNAVYSATAPKTYTTGANAEYIVWLFYSTSNPDYTEQQTKDSMMIELGSTTTTYEAYNGTTKEINLGKNLFDKSFIPAGTTTYNNGFTLVKGTSRTVSISLPQNICDAGTYTLSFDVVESTLSAINKFGFQAVHNNASIGAYTDNTYHKITFTTTTGFERLYFYIMSDQVDSATITIDNVQLEKGSVASSYSAYKTPIELCKIGTYQDYIFRNTTENPLYDSNLEEGQWYIHKEVGKYTFTGNENWIVLPYGTNGWYVSSLINDALFIDTIATIKSNLFIGISNSERASSSYTNKVYIDQFKNIDLRDTTLTTKAQVQSATSGTPIYYVLATPTNTLIEDEELVNQLESIKLISGLNNVSISSPNLPFIMDLVYNYVPAYTEEDILFCGIVKNTGNISLNPRYPHYCNLQVLEFKDFLSQGETLDFVINNKTIEEAIEQVISVIAPYGFIKGEVKLNAKNMVMGAYSTKDKTAYDVFNYLADITQSRWTTRMIDENTIAVDFYDTDKLPVGTPIDYNQTWFANHKIDDMSFSYSSNDYRNKQVMLSGEVYSNIETTEVITADGYQTQFNTIDKIGYVSSIAINGTPATIITKDEQELGYVGDFIYQPGNAYFESDDLISTGAVITIVYYAIIEGREIILNQSEIQRVANMTGRKGIIARYENRNDATTTDELQRIGKSYLKYKGIPEIKLNVSSRENTWNIGDRVIFNSPLAELSQEYMVKSKKIQHITTIDELFYEYELTSSFNMEQEVNFFDNQRYKTNGNIGEGEYISRNIDIENTANIIFYDLEVNEVQISGDSTLQSTLQAPLGVE